MKRQGGWEEDGEDYLYESSRQLSGSCYQVNAQWPGKLQGNYI